MRWLALGLALLLSACSGTTPQTFIDGYPVGERVEGDSRFVDFAMTALDEAIPGHARIASTEIYRSDYRTLDGKPYLLTRSGGDTFVVVFRLVDDSVEAFFVGCGAGVEPDLCFLSGPPSGL